MPARVKVVATEAKNVHNLGLGLSRAIARRVPTVVQKSMELLKECSCPKKP